ncbi:SH3 domain-containing C40 family peptidase [Paenibacillus sp. YN15]|uniref:C40 family peptidase n=1 Tax=Paenibacillus sp. YN15 TaxID=1742774 RepID=UPI0015EBACC9|nr:SH3 domain-containing C40 family peptidase [Paenibacillus sp. YN15]
MKRILPLLLVITFLVMLLPLTAAAEDGVLTKGKIVAGVSFRAKPSTSGSLIRMLKKNEPVTVLEELNPYWYRIEDQNGQQGYISASDKYMEIESNAEVIYGVNMRKAPNTSGDVIRMLAKGEELLVLEKANDSWYKVRDAAGVEGYASTNSKYIKLNTDVYKMQLSQADLIEAFIAEGMKYMGTPYEFGSTRYDTTTFDCSDFVLQAFWNVTATAIPADSRGQAAYVQDLGKVEMDWKNLKRGDLMFFMSYAGSKASDYANVNRKTQEVTHVAIYLGNGQMLHTYSPESGGVRVDSISGKTWEYRYLYGGSFIR